MTLDEAVARLEHLDLMMVRLKLADTEEGKGWASDQLDLGEQEYRRFLALHLLYPDEAIVPCGLVDEVWHAHILDTAAYADDCHAIFGFFLHHFPYFGLRGPDDAANLAAAYERTLALYAREFGEPPAGVWGDSAGRRCRRQCAPMKCK